MAMARPLVSKSKGTAQIRSRLAFRSIAETTKGPVRVSAAVEVVYTGTCAPSPTASAAPFGANSSTAYRASCCSVLFL